jgi:hypothetical protein
MTILISPVDRPEMKDVLQQWANQVLQRTHQRLSDLSLKLQQNAVSIHGLAPSYYVKQLALEGLMMCIANRHLTIHDGIVVKAH